jgi:peptidyl-prolyl cis-trans isomerase A (cyclophilin A)
MKYINRNTLLFLFIYAFAFFIFQMDSHAQEKATPPATETPAAASATKPVADSAPKAAATPAAATPATTPAAAPAAAPIKKKVKKMTAIFDTSMGQFKVKLHHLYTPKTVENFVGLAEGTKVWVDPKTNAQMKKPFFDGLIFHRVIKGFMIQGGDPMGTGFGGPGYTFEDEFVPDLKHDKAGVLSMANAGPNTNGSQFFITLGPTPHLNGKHTVFGEVIEGLDVVKAIGNTPTNRADDKPKTDVVIKKVTIVRE